MWGRLIKILTMQDFVKASDKGAFILRAIQEHRMSDTYIRAEIAQEYYSSNNVEIGKRLGYLERQMRSKVNVKFHRLRNGFFRKGVIKLVMYLMGNGATLDDEIKIKIDRKFDNTMQIAAINACVDGVVWGMLDLDEYGRDVLRFFRATEFVPLFDKRTGKLHVGIYFHQMERNEPLNITLFEIDGITEYEADQHGSNIKEIAPKRTYIQTIRRDAFSTTLIDGTNYNVLPIFPLYANELGESELTTGLQALIDAYDFVSSDWVDDSTLIEGLYGIIRNYGGQDAATLLAEIQQLKVIVQDGNDTGAELQPIQMPFASKQALLDFLERRMYDDFLLPDARNDGRAVTATEIKAAREDMDIKADLLEWQVAEFVEQVLLLKGHDELLANYKRRTNNNDSQDVSNISTQLAGESWIDIEEAIRRDPTIPEDRKDALIERMAAQLLGEADETFPIEGAGVSGADVSQEAEQVAGKTLTGIQTTSLIGIIEKYAAGALTLQQAVNIVSVSIGVTAEEARRIIEGLE